MSHPRTLVQKVRARCQTRVPLCSLNSSVIPFPDRASPSYRTARSGCDRLRFRKTARAYENVRGVVSRCRDGEASRYQAWQMVVVLLMLSSFVFPSLLDFFSLGTPFGSIGSRLSILGVTFVVDELIVLLGLFPLFLSAAREKHLTIDGPRIIYMLFMFYLVSSFLLDYFLRNPERHDLVLRNRWIILNGLYFLAPVVGKTGPAAAHEALIRYSRVAFLLVCLKILFVLAVGADFDEVLLSNVNPDFSTFATVMCMSAIALWQNRLLVAVAVFLAGVTAILSEQFSAIAAYVFSLPLGLAVRSVGRAAWVRHLWVLVCGVVFLSVALLFALTDVQEKFLFLATERFHMNPLSFLSFRVSAHHYFSAWSAALSEVYHHSLLFGMGIGKTLSFYSIPHSPTGFHVAYSLNLMHNMFVTVLFSFGLIGLALLLSLLVVLLRKRQVESRTGFPGGGVHALVRALVFLFLLNFITSPGEWKLRQGVPFWLLLGMLSELRVPRR